MASAGPLPGPYAEPAKSKTALYAAVAAVAAVVVAVFFLMSGGTGGLVISVSGPGGKAVKGVSVWVDGNEICSDSTCKVEDLKPGSYVVKATAQGYAEMAGKAYEVVAGEQKAINIELASEGGTGIKVVSKASGLTLTVNGKKIGTLPQELSDLGAGSHKIELSGSQFIKDFTETVTLKDGEMLEFEPKLELKKGQVNIQLDDTSRDAKVYLLVDDKRRSLASTIKKAQSDTVKIDLPVDDSTYKIIASRSGYEDFEEELKFTVEEPIQTVELTLTEGSSGSTSSPAPSPRPTGTATAPRPSPAPAPAPAPAASAGTGTLNINSLPVSNIILDGRPLGSTPKSVSVSAGSHTVVFIHPEHGRKVSTVNVSSGGVATAAVRFP